MDRYDPVKVGFKDGRGVCCHDKALERASQSDCKLYAQLTHEIDTRKAEDADDRKVFVKGFPPNTSETQLEQHFHKFGEVAEVNLVRDRVTGQSKGYAFIEYLTREDALKAYHVRLVWSETLYRMQIGPLWSPMVLCSPSTN